MMVGFTFIVWFWIIFNIGPVQDYCLLCYGDFTNTCGFCLNCRRACEKWKHLAECGALHLAKVARRNSAIGRLSEMTNHRA
ncbi:hypothetical protein Y032_0031g2368 [Ancylostoma ceylanicum]|uniref:Uncharacterized protein n=1 Tax=Ancylostoma ceylanicum TaxID=53326 RepID=A0A016URY6_9BILA|nr:hypothetical protein Y032_0031g2368 [Ancylostoma ceylanicum]